MTTPPIKLIECPRDAMQGIHEFIPTAKKIKYINALLEVGFDTIDVGSFVSPTIIPQMADTLDVIREINLGESKTKLLAIVPNLKGAKEAVLQEKIHYLGYPFSISETFQLKNTRKTIAQSFELVKELVDLCKKHQKELVVYISMGFGNPYGDTYNEALVYHWAKELINLGVPIISLSDTIGVASPTQIKTLFGHLIPSFPHVEFGAHLHSAASNWKEKIDAATEAGCIRFDGAIKGYGGCPMAEDDMIGNMPTENLVHYFESELKDTYFDKTAFAKAFQLTSTTFP